MGWQGDWEASTEGGQGVGMGTGYANNLLQGIGSNLTGSSPFDPGGPFSGGFAPTHLMTSGQKTGSSGNMGAAIANIGLGGTGTLASGLFGTLGSALKSGVKANPIGAALTVAAKGARVWGATKEAQAEEEMYENQIDDWAEAGESSREARDVGIQISKEDRDIGLQSSGFKSDVQMASSDLRSTKEREATGGLYSGQVESDAALRESTVIEGGEMAARDINRIQDKTEAEALARHDAFSHTVGKNIALLNKKKGLLKTTLLENILA